MTELVDIKVLREKSEPALQQMLIDLAKERFHLRMQEDQSVKPHEWRLIRVGIARIKTVLNEKKV